MKLTKHPVDGLTIDSVYLTATALRYPRPHLQIDNPTRGPVSGPLAQIATMLRGNPLTLRSREIIRNVNVESQGFASSCEALELTRTQQKCQDRWHIDNQ
jgi:hypothetical protein